MRFYGNNYAAKQQKANGIWHLFHVILKVLKQFLRLEEKEINVTSINISTVNMN